MAFESEKRSYDKNNVYAKDIKGEDIHVSVAESGANGYFCLGCDRELQAVKSKRTNRISYYRHVAIDVTKEQKCTYSDETHRHKLAKRILLQNKYIKVPSIVKFPPKGIEGLGNILKDSEILVADSVKVETTFYEDEFGNVKWGSNLDIEQRYLLIKPDIAFFNAKNEPFLFTMHLYAIENKEEYNILEVWIEWPENHVNSWIAVKYNSSFFIDLPNWFEEWEFSEHFQEPELRKIKDLGFAGSCMKFFSLSPKEFSHLFDTEGYQNTKIFGGECLSKYSSAKDVAFNIIDFVKRRS